MQRLWQALAIVLGLLIIVIGGLTAYVFMTRTSSQPPRATPTTGATGSPGSSASAPASGAASGGPSASPSGPSTSTLPTPSGGSPKPSPTTTVPTGPISAVDFRVERIGLDDTSKEGALTRSITFTTHGPGDVRAEISDTSGGVARLCLYKGTPATTGTTPLCNDTATGSVRAIATGATAKWTVVLSSAAAGTRPVTTVNISYRTRTAEVDLTGFRFQGTSDQPRNGFRLHVRARADGPAAVNATWLSGTDPRSLDHRIRIRDLTAALDVTNAAANGESASGGGALKRGHEYQIELRNDAADAGETLKLDATVSWP